MNRKYTINKNVSNEKQEFKSNNNKTQTEKTMLITDETSIYAIDMECFKEKADKE